MIIPIKDKYGKTLLELDSEVFPLEMPLETIFGDRTYYLHVYFTEDNKVRSALLNTKK